MISCIIMKRQVDFIDHGLEHMVTTVKIERKGAQPSGLVCIRTLTFFRSRVIIHVPVVCCVVDHAGLDAVIIKRRPLPART